MNHKAGRSLKIINPVGSHYMRPYIDNPYGHITCALTLITRRGTLHVPAFYEKRKERTHVFVL